MEFQKDLDYMKSVKQVLAIYVVQPVILLKDNLLIFVKSCYNSHKYDEAYCLDCHKSFK